MSYVKGDPYWITARHPGAGACASCATAIPRGARSFYWPKGKRLECASCGESSWRRFEAECADEVWS